MSAPGNSPGRPINSRMSPIISIYIVYLFFYFILFSPFYDNIARVQTSTSTSLTHRFQHIPKSHSRRVFAWLPCARASSVCACGCMHASFRHARLRSSVVDCEHRVTLALSSGAAAAWLPRAARRPPRVLAPRGPPLDPRSGFAKNVQDETARR